MSCGLRNTLLVVLVGVVFSSAGVLFGATLDLNPDGRKSIANIGVTQASSGTSIHAGIVENATIRDLRDNFVRDWYIFADTKNDGILNPGDTRVATFKNWWTPMSAATQHGYEIGASPVPYMGPDHASNPIDHQHTLAGPTGNDTFYMPQKAGAIGFYLTYSSLDNADYETEAAQSDPASMQRNLERNGFAMGWLTGAVEKNASGSQIVYGPSSAAVKMDIFIHKGKSGPGTNDYDFGTGYSRISRSNPQVAQSNDMSLLAKGDNNLMVVPDYKDTFDVSKLGTATSPYGDDDGYLFTGFNEGKYKVNKNLIGPYDNALVGEFQAVVDSMDVREVNSYDYTDSNGVFHAGLDGLNPIDALETPQMLLTNQVKDGRGNQYLYEDSFLSRDGRLGVGADLNDGSLWIQGSTDGGVLAGLSGFDKYGDYYPGGATPDPTKLLTHWGEQQVIRIDIDDETLAMITEDNGINKIIFYDWGMPDKDTGQQAKDPREIVFKVAIDAFGDKILYFDKDGNNAFDVLQGDISFPDNRIYIAQVEHAPEPATMMVLVAGGSALLARRRRRRK
jgi:hypothetical protein